MSTLFSSNFETGDTSDFTSASGSVQSAIKKTGNYAGDNENNDNFIKVLESSYATLYMSGDFRFSVAPGVWWFVMLGYRNNVVQYELRFSGYGTGIFVMCIPDSYKDLYYGTRVFLPNVWYHIEVKFVSHSTNGYFEVRVDHQLEIIKFGIDTQNGALTGIDEVRWQGINYVAGHCYVDDVLIADTSPRYSMRVSLPGYDALTDPDINNYALYTDSDNILIKEKARGSVTVPANTTTNLAHGLTYIPMVLVYCEAANGEIGTNGRWFLLGSNDGYSMVGLEITTTYIKIINNAATYSKNCKYYVFYDQQV